MRVIACLLDAGGRPLPDGFVNVRLRRRLGMRGRGPVMVENQGPRAIRGRCYQRAPRLSCQSHRDYGAGRGGGTYSSAAVEGTRHTTGTQRSFLRSPGPVLRLVTG